MLCIPLWNGYFKIQGAKEDPIPNVIKDHGGEVQGTPKATLPHSGAQSTNWTSTEPRQLQYNRQGGPGPCKVNQRINLHKGK